MISKAQLTFVASLIVVVVACGSTMTTTMAFQQQGAGTRLVGTAPRIVPSSGKNDGKQAPRRMSSDNFENFRSRNAAGRRLPDKTFGSDAIPEEQQPANEYLDLIQQPLFNWASEEVGTGGLAFRLAAVYAAFFALVCYPIAGATFVEEGYFLQKLTAANVGATFVVFILLIRLYSGWGFVGSRLQSKIVEYEQTGWYDGDFEMKSDSERARDLFLYRKDVKPVEDRLKLFSLGIGCALVVSCVGLNAATHAKPIFNEYDTTMLKNLQSDDKLANVAARQSNGRPTYCESRYYRAIANGGQGCN